MGIYFVGMDPYVHTWHLCTIYRYGKRKLVKSLLTRLRRVQVHRLWIGAVVCGAMPSDVALTFA